MTTTAVLVVMALAGSIPVTADVPPEEICREISTLVAQTLDERSRSDGELVQAISEKVHVRLCRS